MIDKIKDMLNSKYKYAFIAAFTAVFLFLLFIGVNEAIDANLND